MAIQIEKTDIISSPILINKPVKNILMAIRVCPYVKMVSELTLAVIGGATKAPRNENIVMI